MPWRNQFKSNEEYNAYYRDYRAKNLKKIRAYNNKYNSEWRKANGYHNEIKWKLKNPEKLLAQQQLRRAVKKGIIRRKRCAVCNKLKAVAHHFDYTKPLEVIWLCHSHHRQIHYGDN